MRKLLNVLLVAVLGLLVFTACNPSSSVSEDLVSVELMTGQSRALTVSLNFSLEGKKWKYSAVKNKNDNGLTTGTTKVGDVDTPKVLTDGKTKPLSQGYWDFTLYGYAENDDDYATVICQGTVENVLITMEKNTVIISVKPTQEKTGTIVIKNDITILDKDGVDKEKTGNYTRVVTVYNAASGDTVKTEAVVGESDIEYDNMSSKITYKVVVSFIGDYNKDSRYTAATAVKYVNVYDDLTTTVSGSIVESATEVTINATVGADFSATASIAADLFEASSEEDDSPKVNKVPITVASSAAETKTGESGTVEVKDSATTIPAGSIVKDTDNTDAVTLKMASKNLIKTVTDSEGKTTTSSELEKDENNGMARYIIAGTSGAPAAEISFGLEGAALDSSINNKNPEKAPTGYQYIATGLGASFDLTNDDRTDDTVTLTIGYVAGSGTVATVDKETEAGQTPELLRYDSDTGYLEYRVYHYSTYVIYTDKYVASDSNGNLYETLDEAAEKVAEGATITLWKNIKNSGEETEISFENNGAILDLNSKTVERSLELGSIGCKDDKILMTIKNGTVKSNIINWADGGFNNGAAVLVWKPFAVIESGTYINDNIVLNIQCQGVYDVNGNLVDGSVNDCMTNLMIKDGVFSINAFGAVCVNQVIGKTEIYGGTFEAKNAAVFRLMKGDSKQPSKVIVYGGNFDGMLLICYDTSNGGGAQIEIRGGNFTYGSSTAGDKTISYLMEAALNETEYSNLTDAEKLARFESIPKDSLKIYGGTFSTDPSNIIPDYKDWNTSKTINYVADGYKATQNENGTWTVSKIIGD